MKFNRKKIFAWLLAGFFLVAVSAALTLLTHPVTKRLLDDAPPAAPAASD